MSATVIGSTHWDVVCEIMDDIQEAKTESSITKKDLIENLEKKMCIMMQKMLSNPQVTSYSIYKK